MHRPTDTSDEGVIILSPSFHVMHMSPRAAQLIRPLANSPTQNASGPALPTVLHSISQEIRNQLQTSLTHGNGLTCDMEHSIPSSEGTLFVRGLGVPDQYGGEFLTILLVSKSPVNIPSV